MKNILVYLISILFLTFFLCVHAYGQEMFSTSFGIPTSVLSGGGVSMTSNSYQMNGTLGQPSPLMDSYPLYSTTYDLYPGFWYILDTTLSYCRWDIEPESGDGDVDGSDLAVFAGGDVSAVADFGDVFGRVNCGE